MKRFFIGLDLAMVQDFTALCLVEMVQFSELIYHHVRYLMRFPLGTLYPVIIEDIKQLLETPELKNEKNKVKLLVDATGAGRPVVDMLRAAKLRPSPVIITAGNVATYEHGFWHVPKRDLVSTLQVLLQTGRLKFAEEIPETQTLIDELLAFQVKISTDGRDTYGNDWRQNPHDDMVLALALACWYGERKKVVKFYHGLVK